MTLWALLVGATLGSAPAAAVAPPDQELVFFNARIAQREERPADVLRLWLLRNSLVDLGQPGTRDEEFRSVVWAALGKLGMCPDGLPDDGGGAALWPLALHNFVVLSAARGPAAPLPVPYEAFGVGRQQRLVSLHDVLSAEELRSVSFFRTQCFRAQTAMLQLGQPLKRDLTDRIATGKLLRGLLERALTTVVLDKVENLALVEARIFDLDLVLAELQARQGRSEGRAAAQQARSVGISAQGAQEAREKAQVWTEGSAQAEFLRRSLLWGPQEWLTLGKQRRLFLFKQAQPLSSDQERLEGLVLGIIDRLIERRQGEELESWMGFLEAGASPRLRQQLTSGERGVRMLELDAQTGFRERAPIALQRGVAFLEEGRLQEALRSFAFALRHAEDSREAAACTALSRRWLAFVLSRYETTEEVIATLRALVPRGEYNAAVEVLVWRAALGADAASLERVAASLQRGGALEGRVERLRPLAAGRPGELATRLRRELTDEPYTALRFIRHLVERIEAEEARVRTANVPTLKHLMAILGPLSAEVGGKNSGHARVALELIGRTQAILEGLHHLDDSGPGQARSLSPRSETFAGSVRLAPVDALPWPFLSPEPQPPSVFVPLSLVPVEWWDARGARVFGWRITE